MNFNLNLNMSEPIRTPENTFNDCFTDSWSKFENVQNLDINKINDILLSKGLRMDRGYGKFKGQAFRIPHMGNIYMDDLKEYLNEIDKLLWLIKY